METLIFEPFLPPALLGALWVVAGMFCVGYAFWKPTRLKLHRRLILAVLHFVPLCAVLLMLYGPTWVRVAGEDGNLPALDVLVDTSASMATQDQAEKQSRYAAGAQAIVDQADVWRRTFALRAHCFDREEAPFVFEGAADRQPTGSVTDLAGAVIRTLGKSPKPAALLVFSDGIHNAQRGDLESAAREARAQGVPVYTCPMGTAVTVQDLGLTLSGSEELCFVNQHLKLPVIVTQVGYESAEVEVELRLNGAVKEKRRIRFESGAQRADMEFEVTSDRTGLYTYEVAIPPRPGEALVTNNRGRFVLRVVNDRIRVLLLEGKPYWDTKFLGRSLRLDPNVMLTTATLVRPDRMYLVPPSKVAEGAQTAGDSSVAQVDEPDPSWIPPRDPLDPLGDRRFLAQYQVVMLGRNVEALLKPDDVEVLRDWISHGSGHLICTRGRPVADQAMDPLLAGILPVAWRADREKKFRMQLTERGRALAVFEFGSEAERAAHAEDPEIVLKSLPSLVTATAVDKEQAMSVVLARASGQDAPEQMAVLSMQRYGSGRTIVLEGQGLWRWAFRPPQDELHGEDLFSSFWANLIRWLAGSNEFLPSQEVVLRAGKPVYVSGESPNLYVVQRETVGGGTPAVPGSVQSLPSIEVVREGVMGQLDPTFKAVRASPHPLPRDPQMLCAELAPLEEGFYRARLVTEGRQAETVFEVLPPLREKLDLRARPEVLAVLSKATDAQALDLSAVGKLSEYFSAFVRQHKPGNEIKRPAWDHAVVLVMLMAWAGATWCLRRRWGAL